MEIIPDQGTVVKGRVCHNVGYFSRLEKENQEPDQRHIG